MSKPSHEGRQRQLSVWLPAGLLIAVNARAKRVGIDQRLAVIAALAAFAKKRGPDRRPRRKRR